MNATHLSSIALALAALLASAAHANATDGEPIDVAVDALKREYLACDRAAMSSQLSTGSIMHCSVVYEELKRRAFGGDFMKLLDWAKAQRAPQYAGRS